MAHKRLQPPAEFRQPARLTRGELQELYDDGRDSEIDGVIQRDYRDASQQGFAGDELYFTGYDLGQSRKPMLRHALHNDYWDGQGEDKDAVLVRSALERIEKARTKGKTNVSLSAEEMDALTRGSAPAEQPAPLVSPPTTPSKSSKAKSSGRSSSLSNMAVVKARKKSNSPKPKPRSNSKAKMVRKVSTDTVPIYHPTANSVLVQGPDGTPMYAPLITTNDFNEPLTRSRSHSNSRHDMADHFASRFVQQRPSSSSAAFQRQDEYYQPPMRARSGSNVQTRPHEDYNQHGRRIASGPPEVSYSTLRRVPQAQSPLRNTGIQHSHSDPNVNARRVHGRYDESPSSSSSDDQGVRVDIIPDGSGAGYSISRKPAKEADSKRKKSRR